MMRPSTHILALVALFATLGATLPALAQSVPSEPGAEVFKRCAACHLANGEGVPGAFPPLSREPAAFSKSDEGRRYLALAVIRGLSGPLTVEGKPYVGTMPAQANLDDASVAAVLNYVTGSLAGSTNDAQFTAQEVAAARRAGDGMSATDVARLQPKAVPQ